MCIFASESQDYMLLKLCNKDKKLIFDKKHFFVSEVESQFNHRKVTFKRNKDVRTGFDMLCEIGR